MAWSSVNDLTCCPREAGAWARQTSDGELRKVRMTRIDVFAGKVLNLLFA